MIRTALRSLLARKLRLLLSTVAIVLGVAFVAGSLIFSDLLDRSFTALFASAVGDVVVQPAAPTSGPAPSVPAALVERLAEVPGAARADGNISVTGVYVIGEDGRVVGGIGPPALAGNWTGAPAGHGLEGLTILDGRAPEGPDEVVLDEATAEKAGYEIGDDVPLNTTTAEEDLEPTVVGIAGFEDGGSLNGATLVLFDTTTAQSLFLDGADAYTDAWVTAEEGISQEELRDAVAEVLPDRLEAVTGDDAAEDAATGLLENLDFLTTLLLIFAGIALVVGAFLIVNTFSILLAQRSRELALLRALGASRAQVTGSVLLEALVVGVVGSTLGLGLGFVLAVGIRGLMGTFGLELSGSLPLTGRTVLASYGVGVAVTLAAAWLPARRTGRIPPVQALRDEVALPESTLRRRLWLGLVLLLLGGTALWLGLYADVPDPGWWTGAGVLGILLGVTAVNPMLSRPLLLGARAAYGRAFGTIGRLAGHNTLRNPRRTAATASALMIGLALAVTMAVIGASAKASVDRAVEENFVGDFVIASTLLTPFSADLGDRIEDVEGVESVIRQRYWSLTVEEEGGPLYEGIVGVDPATLDELMVEVTAGDAGGLAPGTVLVTDSWAEDEGYDVGDSLRVDADAGPRELEITGLIAESEVVPLPVITSLETWAELGYPPQDNMLVVDAVDSSDATEEAIADALADQPIVTVLDQQEFAAERRAPIDRLVAIVFALLGLALIIAVLGIVNTLALSVIERTREIGLLRAVGASRRQLRGMVSLESVVISLVGAVLGVMLGVLFGTALMYAVREEGLEVIAVPWGQMGLFLVAAIVAGLLAAVLPARRAARLDVLHAIAQE